MIWSSEEFFLLYALLAVVVFWIFIQRRRRVATLQFPSLKYLKQVSSSVRTKFVWLPMTLKIAGLALIVVALARPQQADTKIKRDVEGIDIMIALDISDSMLIEDMKPENRLEASKKTIEDFISKRISDRIGLIVFSGESYTRVPMTLDYPLLIDNLRKVETSRNIKMGTAIGVALANSVIRLKDSKAKSRVVVFLTDGENNTGTIDPQTALQIAKDESVRIYSIGMGRDGQTQLPVYTTDVFGRRRKRYRPIHSKINEGLSDQMAKDTGGKYYRATTTNALEQVFADINKLETTKIEASQFTRYTELFQSYLFWAVLLYLSGMIFGATFFLRGP